MHYETIHKTYREHFSSLSDTKKIHFLTRLRLVLDDPWATQEINNYRDIVLGGKTPKQWSYHLDNLLATPPNYSHVNAAEARKPFFDDYPWLFGTELALFQHLHAKVQFNVDQRSLFTAEDTLSQSLQTMVAHPATLATLSTYLVDSFYLYWHFYRDDSSQMIELSQIQAAIDTRLSPHVSAKLKLYLLTHCIIGETLFYSRSIPNDRQAYCRELLRIADGIAERHWSDGMSIDTKLELALCHQLVSNEPHILIDRATTDADHHFSAELGYITDPLMPHKNDLDWAEHRNILYLMVTGRKA